MVTILRCVTLTLAVVAASASASEPKVSPSSSSQRKFSFPGFGAGFKGVSHRNTGLVKSGKINELRGRIRSVGNSQKITAAMKLVASAKVRKAQEAVLCGRPFADNLQKILRNLLDKLKLEDVDLPVLTTRPVKHVTIVAITGDRGLCGSYNAQIIKRTTARMDQLKSFGIGISLVNIGKKGTSWFKRRDYPVIDTYDCPQKPTAEFSGGVASKLLNSYLAGDTDRIEVVYSKFVSMVENEPQIVQFLPRNQFELATELENQEDKGDDITQEVLFEQEPETLLDAALPLYFNGQLLRTVQDSVASELAARVQAMSSASDNAKQLKKGLTLEMNRARQAEVTQSMLEIVAGSDA